MNRLDKRIDYITRQLNTLSNNNIPFTLEVLERSNKPYESMFTKETEENDYFSDWLDDDMCDTFEYHHWNYSSVDKDINKYENKALYLQCTYLDTTNCECHVDTVFFFKKNGTIDVVTFDYCGGDYGHDTITFPFKLSLKAFIKKYIGEYKAQALNAK